MLGKPTLKKYFRYFMKIYDYEKDTIEIKGKYSLRPLKRQ